MKLTENENTAIVQLKEQLSKKFNLIEFRIFGSKARGQSTADSDIDVMIELDESNFDKESEIYDLIFNINLTYDVFISPLFISKKEIEEGIMSESPVYKKIQREGVSI
jgi:predicted nucleotidyltransferase